jgi:hypothetical protein
VIGSGYGDAVAAIMSILLTGKVNDVTPDFRATPNCQRFMSKLKIYNLN